MPTILVDGISIELPDEATPVHVLEPVLRRAWLQRRRASGLPYAPGESILWPELLFQLWAFDLIELIGRAGEPDAPPAVIGFPPQERLWSRFSVRSLIPYDELFYRPTRRRFFDVHLRIKPAIADKARPTPAKPRAEQPTKTAERVDFICQFCMQGKLAATMNSPEVFAALRQVYGARHRLLQIQDRAERKCWRAVKKRNPWGVPQDTARDAAQTADDK